MTSAKSNIGVDELFEKIGMKFIDPNYDPNKTENQEKMEYEQKKGIKSIRKKKLNKIKIKESNWNQAKK